MAALRSWESDDKASLFARIKSNNTLPNSKLELFKSIRVNLARILNSRPGECHGSSALGIVDINDALLGSAELQNSLCGSIQTCIDKFEPRINCVEVKVSYDVDSLHYHFSIYAHLKNITEQEIIEIDIQLSNNKFKVF